MNFFQDKIGFLCVLSTKKRPQVDNLCRTKKQFEKTYFRITNYPYYET